MLSQGLFCVVWGCDLGRAAEPNFEKLGFYTELSQRQAVLVHAGGISRGCKALAVYRER